METTNPYQTPEAEVTSSDNSAKVQTPKFFAVNGRIGRLRYMCYSMGAYVVTLVFALLIAIIASVMGMSEEQMEPIVTVVMLVIMLPFALIICKRRGHDLGMKTAYVALMFVPFVNFFYGLYLTFAAGIDAENEYGLPPSENSFGVKFVLGFVVIMFVVFIVLALMSAKS